ncbi:12223_t:CDS:1 [Acaulospora morrowiae]|uniref:ribonuclease III n=1 Tax=Acaulospora morrowiae TaxID=94023 RepID=A0A9N9F7G9_9GLOM|nr:12223_t:CDS:1 [Acaulospora morrowiae]
MSSSPSYPFTNKRLEVEALTHKSYCYENPMSGHHNERLEFLGDSIVGFLVARYLYKRFPEYTEGQLSMLRAKLVCKQSLAGFAYRLGLNEKLRLGLGSASSRNNEKILEDAFEAYVGAIFMDSNSLDKVGNFVEELISPMVDKLISTSPTSMEDKLPAIPKPGPENLVLSPTLEHQDPIGKLQTWSLKKGFPIPHYREVRVTGNAHEPWFTIEVYINGSSAGTGEGRNKREAKKKAAIAAYDRLTTDPPPKSEHFQSHVPDVFTGPSN